MPKPQRSTLDKWLDNFADFDPDTQEKALDTCALLHRQTKRFAARNTKDPVDGPIQQELNGGEQ
jgi:hypothetical protein